MIHGSAMNSQTSWLTKLIVFSLTVVCFCGGVGLLRKGIAGVGDICNLLLISTGCILGIVYLVFGPKTTHRISKHLGHPVAAVNKPVDSRLALLILALVLVLVGMFLWV